RKMSVKHCGSGYRTLSCRLSTQTVARKNRRSPPDHPQARRMRLTRLPQLRQSLSYLVGIHVFGVDLQHPFEVLLREGRLLGLLIRQSKMIMVGGFLGTLLQSLFEEIDRHIVSALLKVGPAQSIGGIGRVRHSTARGLRHRERHIDIAALL